MTSIAELAQRRGELETELTHVREEIASRHGETDPRMETVPHAVIERLAQVSDAVIHDDCPICLIRAERT